MIEQDPTNLAGMSAAAAKEYILGFITTLKLTEKEIHSLEGEAARWKGRLDLARTAEEPRPSASAAGSRGAGDLLAEAEREAERINTRLAALREEERSLKSQIDAMRRQLPGLSARERSIDPDLLEQEMLMALGQTGEEAATERSFRELEKNAAADVALEELKAKMKGETP